MTSIKRQRVLLSLLSSSENLLCQTLFLCFFLCFYNNCPNAIKCLKEIMKTPRGKCKGTFILSQDEAEHFLAYI